MVGDGPVGESRCQLKTDYAKECGARACGRRSAAQLTATRAQRHPALWRGIASYRGSTGAARRPDRTAAETPTSLQRAARTHSAARQNARARSANERTHAGAQRARTARGGGGGGTFRSLRNVSFSNTSSALKTSNPSLLPPRAAQGMGARRAAAGQRGANGTAHRTTRAQRTAPSHDNSGALVCARVRACVCVCVCVRAAGRYFAKMSAEPISCAHVYAPRTL
jgi:hypothetical protein